MNFTEGVRIADALERIAKALEPEIIHVDAAMQEADDPLDSYLVWSNEHRAWWRPGHQGYTPNYKDAGRYSRKEALTICQMANVAISPGHAPNEVPVREADALHVLEA